MTAIIIPGFTADDFVPGAVIETKFGGGKQSAGNVPQRVLVTGNKLTTGSATADLDVNLVGSVDEADALYGAGSEIAVQCYAALEIPGVVLYGAPVAEASTGGPASATLTITIGGTWSTVGSVLIRLVGKVIQTAVSASDTTNTVAANLSAAINSTPRLPFSASVVGSVVTVTVLNKGTRGNDYVGATDKTVNPPGLTVALSGGTPLTGGVTPFSGGAGADSVTNVLAILTATTWDYQAWAQNDATNAALIKAQLESQIGPLIQHPGFAVFGKNRSTSTSVTFAQTTLNEYLACVAHMTNSESSPAQIAAQVAAVFSVDTASANNPNKRFVKRVLPKGSIAPQSQEPDKLQRTTAKTLLQSGVTPLTTLPDGTVLIVDAVCSHSLNGSSPDYRTRHVGDVFTPIRIGKDLRLLWDDFSEANEYVQDDPAQGANPAPEGRGTPSSWESDIMAYLKEKEDANWIQAVDQNPPVAIFDHTAQRIMTAVPIVVATQNVNQGTSVRQVAAS